MKKVISVVVCMLMIMMSLTACQFGTSSPQDKLNAYIKSSEFEEQIKSVRDSFDSMLDINVSSKDTDIVFDFVYRTQIPSESVSAVKDSLSTSLSYLSSNFKELIIGVEKKLGLENVRIIVNMKTNDGTNITTVIYTDKGVEGSDTTEPVAEENTTNSSVTETPATGNNESDEPTIGGNDEGKVANGDTSEDNPAPRGTWVGYSVRDYSKDALFKAEARVSKITTESDNKEYINTAIDKYNSEHSFSQIDKNSLDSKCEFVVADLDIRIPQSESVVGYKGVPAPLSYGIKKSSGVSYETTSGERVIFATSVSSIEDDSLVVSSGDVVHTQIIYSMVKGFKNYSIELTSHSMSDDFTSSYLSAY